MIVLDKMTVVKSDYLVQKLDPQKGTSAPHL